jgi:porin
MKALLFISLVLPVIGMAQNFSSVEAASPVKAVEPSSENTRSWHDAISKTLADKGLDVSITHTLEFYNSTYAPAATDRNARNLLDLQVHWHPSGFLHDGTVTAEYASYSETNGTSDPSVQGFSNLSAKPFHHLTSLYLDLPFASRFRLKLGKVDANTEFSVIQNGGDFSNASLGVSPALFAMPSYPEGAPSVNLFAKLTSRFDAGAGAYRTPSGSIYSVAEVTAHSTGDNQRRLAVGLWKDCDSRVQGASEAHGAYVIYEQSVISHDKGNTGLHVFTRISTAAGQDAPARAHIGYGATWTGIRSRQDAVGFAVLDLIPPQAADQFQPQERAYEAYYKFPVGHYLTMKTDLEKIQNPGYQKSQQDGLVAAVRLIFNFGTRED